MRYTLDTEFYEKPNTIDLISIGLVSEDGRAYYAENALFDWELCNPNGSFNPDDTQRWLWENVRPHVLPIEERKLPQIISREILEFVGGSPEFWGYYSDYDWVVFCWLFGRMIDLPRGFPMYCLDLKQVMVQNKIKREALPKQEGTVHNALDDARWMMTVLRNFLSTGLV